MLEKNHLHTIDNLFAAIEEKISCNGKQIVNRRRFDGQSGKARI